MRFAVLMLACASLSAQQAPEYSLEKEAALGERLAAEFRQRSAPLGSPAVQQYVDRLGRRILAQVADAKFAFTFSMIAEDPCRTLHEPVALPGGYVFVPAALVVAVRHEAELAGMLAHAIQHIEQRHGARQAARGSAVNYAAVPLIFTGGWAGNCGDGMAVPGAFLEQQRNNELEADFLAVQATARAGYDPAALQRYIQRVQPEGPRAANLRAAIEALPAANYGPLSGEFSAVQQEVRRLVEKQPPNLRR